MSVLNMIAKNSIAIYMLIASLLSICFIVYTIMELWWCMVSY